MNGYIFQICGKEPAKKDCNYSGDTHAEAVEQSRTVPRPLSRARLR
jgi:hypothetical protein